MDPSKLPPAHYIPGRQEAIDHAGKIDKKPFVISASVFFGAALLSVAARFAIRILGWRKLRWDDGFVLVAIMTLIAAFGVCLKELNTLYLVEAMNKKFAVPFREEIPDLIHLLKWATIFAAMNWTLVYMFKFAFMHFFYTLILGLSTRITRFYWTTIGILVVCWVYTVLNPVIICPHFGSNRCRENPHQHSRSVAGNVLVAVMDILCDILIVAVPIVVLNTSMMPFSQKLSIAARLCLSVFMIIRAMIRLVGSSTDTEKDGSGTVPVWATYWAITEGCISLIMTPVIVIRGVFITNLIHNDRRKQESIMQRFGRRLLSTLRLSGSSSRSRRSPQRGDDNVPNDTRSGETVPKIATQNLPQAPLNTLKAIFRGYTSNNQTETQESVDATYVLEDMDYHSIRRTEAAKPAPIPSPAPQRAHRGAH